MNEDSRGGIGVLIAVPFGFVWMFGGEVESHVPEDSWQAPGEEIDAS